MKGSSFTDLINENSVICMICELKILNFPHELPILVDSVIGNSHLNEWSRNSGRMFALIVSAQANSDATSGIDRADGHCKKLCLNLMILDVR